MNLGVNWNRSLCNCDCRNLMIRGAKCLQIFFCRFLNSYFGPKCNVPAHCTRSSPAPSQAVIGCHLPPVCRHLSPIDSGSGPQVTWPGYWPLIGQQRSRDPDAGLWLVESVAQSAPESALGREAGSGREDHSQHLGGERWPQSQQWVSAREVETQLYRGAGRIEHYQHRIEDNLEDSESPVSAST